MVFTAPPIMELADRAPLSRWAHVSGNAPRCRLSIFSDHRLQHLPMFSPLLNHVHRQAPVLPVSASRRSLPRSVGPSFGRTPLAAVSDAARRQEEGQAQDLAWAFVAQRHGSDGVSAATGGEATSGQGDAGGHVATLQRVAANMLPEGSERDLEECLRHFVLLNMPPGTELCRAGAPAQCMYILLHGRVRVDGTAAAPPTVRGRRRCLRDAAARGASPPHLPGVWWCRCGAQAEATTGMYAPKRFDPSAGNEQQGDWVEVDAVAAPSLLEVGSFMQQVRPLPWVVSAGYKRCGSPPVVRVHLHGQRRLGTCQLSRP